MLNYTWSAELAEQERRQDMLDYAEEQRRYPLAKSAGGNNKLLSRWLYALGEQLVTWGCRLQARYRQVVPNGKKSRCNSPMLGTTQPRQI